MTFIRLKNLGSPTRWDAGAYFLYRDSSLATLSDDLLSMVCSDRYRLDSDGTFWYAQLVAFTCARQDLQLTFQSATNRRSFVFSYFGVKKVMSDFSALRSMPALIVQELTMLKGGVYRHALTDMTGRGAVVYSDRMSFSEMPVH